MFILISKTWGGGKYCQDKVPVNFLRCCHLFPKLPSCQHCKLPLHVCAPAVLHAAPGSHGPVYGGFPVSQECNVTLISKAHAYTHELPQYSKVVNTSIYRQPRESCKQSWCHVRTSVLVRVGFIHYENRLLPNPKQLGPR